MPELTTISHGFHQGHDPNSDGQKWLAALGIGTALIAGAVILSPYVIPLLHVGNTALAAQTFTAVHGTGLGKGLVGIINAAINTVPLIGPAIAKGGIASVLATGVTGIGGVLLGQYIEKKDDGKVGIKWGKVIKTAALITSALIAMPAILSGITMGIVYCCAAFSGLELASAAITFLGSTIGASGAMGATAGLSGAATVLPHLFTCGMPVITAGAAWIMGKNKKHSNRHADDMQHDLPATNQKYSDGSIIAEMSIEKPLVDRQQCVAKLTLKNAYTGQAITPEELAVVHTKKLHLFVADSSLKDYHHIHPQPTGEPGVFACTFTPMTSNNYSAWTDFTMLKDGQYHKLKTEMLAASGRNIRPTIRTNDSAEQNCLQFNLDFSEPLQSGKASVATITITDRHGNTVNDLEPVMGAFAHLVGFSADGKSIIHTHPMGEEPTNDSDRGAGKLRFHIEPDCFGATQFYLQIKQNGQDIYVPFGQHIKQPEMATERVQASYNDTHGMLHGH